MCKFTLIIIVLAIGLPHCQTLRCDLMSNKSLINEEVVTNLVQRTLFLVRYSLTCQKLVVSTLESQVPPICSGTTITPKVRACVCSNVSSKYHFYVTWGRAHFLAWCVGSLLCLPPHTCHGLTRTTPQFNNFGLHFIVVGVFSCFFFFFLIAAIELVIGH